MDWDAWDARHRPPARARVLRGILTEPGHDEGNGERRLGTPAAGFRTGRLWIARHDAEGSHGRRASAHDVFQSRNTNVERRNA
jgi:hypothetical protein